MLKSIFRELQHENSIQKFENVGRTFDHCLGCLPPKSYESLHYCKTIILPLASTEKQIFDFQCVTKNSVTLPL